MTAPAKSFIGEPPTLIDGQGKPWLKSWYGVRRRREIGAFRYSRERDSQLRTQKPCMSGTLQIEGRVARSAARCPRMLAAGFACPIRIASGCNRAESAGTK